MAIKVKFNQLARERLEDMAAAGEDIEKCYRYLHKANANIVGQVIANQGTFYEMDHYPDGDVYDDDSHGQYYYHSHRDGEHGHFHTFLRSKGMPEHVKPLPYDGEGAHPLGDDALCHLIAISMSNPGFPISLFTTNKWVTGESWYSAEDTNSLLQHFAIEHVFPCLAVNQWIGAILKLFTPQIELLVLERDRSVADWANKHANEDVYEDRNLEITSSISIDVKKQIAAVNRALKQHRASV
jgi:Domain of unknown function (DUF6969)